MVDGRGFVLLRGLPVDRWPLERTARVYWAIGSRVGVPISQNRVGNLLGHVTDVGGAADHPNQRGHQSSDALAFHTDIGAEIVAVSFACRERGPAVSPPWRVPPLFGMRWSMNAPTSPKP